MFLEFDKGEIPHKKQFHLPKLLTSKLLKAQAVKFLLLTMCCCWFVSSATFGNAWGPLHMLYLSKPFQVLLYLPLSKLCWTSKGLLQSKHALDQLLGCSTCCISKPPGSFSILLSPFPSSSCNSGQLTSAFQIHCNTQIDQKKPFSCLMLPHSWAESVPVDYETSLGNQILPHSKKECVRGFFTHFGVFNIFLTFPMPANLQNSGSIQKPPPLSCFGYNRCWKGLGTSEICIYEIQDFAICIGRNTHRSLIRINKKYLDDDFKFTPTCFSYFIWWFSYN